MKNDCGVVNDFDSDFFFIMAHLTNLNEEELLVSNICIEELGI